MAHQALLPALGEVACRQQGDKEARAEVLWPEPGPMLQALSLGVPSPPAPSTHTRPFVVTAHPLIVLSA